MVRKCLVMVDVIICKADGGGMGIKTSFDSALVAYRELCTCCVKEEDDI